MLGAGDIHFRLDHADFRSGAGSTESEFYLEIDNHELVFAPRGEGTQAQVELRLEFFHRGRKLEAKSYPLEIEAQGPGSGGTGTGGASSRTQVLQLRVGAPAESDSIHAWVEDRNARKRGLFHMFTQTRKSGEAGASLALRRFPAGELSVSDLEFARAVGDGNGGATFVKSGMDVEPHPGRVYGASAAAGFTYLEVYDLRAGEEAGAEAGEAGETPAGERRQYELQYALRDTEGKAFRSWTRTLASRSPTWADTARFEVTDLPSGTYFLGVVVKERSGPARAAVESSFEVLWAAADWVRWVAETEAVVPFLLHGEELDYFLTLAPGAKQRHLDRFWLAHDPTPGAGNATHEEFDRRVSYANSNFSTALEPGMRTDRGRVYVRYGEPDEIRREVIPVQGNDLNAAIRELEHETGGELKGARDIDPKDSRSFEVWLYEYRGDELFPREGMSTSLGRKFIFVDDLGVGDFRLVLSTEKSEF